MVKAAAGVGGEYSQFWESTPALVLCTIDDELANLQFLLCRSRRHELLVVVVGDFSSGVKEITAVCPRCMVRNIATN